MKKTALTATAIARMAGCSRSTVLNYSRAGVLSPIILSDRTRVFDEEDVARVREIAASMSRGRKRKPAEGGSR